LAHVRQTEGAKFSKIHILLKYSFLVTFLIKLVQTRQIKLVNM